MSRLRSNVSGNVHFGVGALVGIYLLPMIVGGFRKCYPGVNLSMQVGNSREVLRCLRDGILELGIVSEPIPENRYVTLPFYQDDLTLIVPPDHPWCREKEVDAECIFEEDFIIREPGSGTRAVYTGVLKDRYPRKKLKVAMVLGSTEAIKRGVIGRMGISIVSPLACRLETEQGLLKKIAVRGVNMKRNFDIVYRSEDDLSIQAVKWKEYLLKQRDNNFELG
jgi:DNA-binding transcriptional LysR family regulator